MPPMYKNIAQESSRWPGICFDLEFLPERSANSRPKSLSCM